MAKKLACGGFSAEIGRNAIAIRRAGGRFDLVSSADGGGLMEGLDGPVRIYNGDAAPGGFAVRARAGISSASASVASHGLTSVSALAAIDPDPCGDPGEGCGAVVALMIDAELPPAAMARAAVTATEAVTCAFQRLMIGDPSTGQIATGSDSLSVTVMCAPGCGLRLLNAGKHSKLGELIGKTVTDAALSSMGKGGATPASRSSALARLERFGVTEETLRAYAKRGQWSAVEASLTDPLLLAYASAAI
ncbi:MAG: adenosylcobinamide amidohydrolase [Candidatus Methanoplasma sp.]|jgi:adenosylcobinamide amidohydrolase|nr:adenosylcobinamide amidohydrolase [Candidatus Methanoplasma sp.]